MCGIAGAVGLSGIDQSLVANMLASLWHRGPDSHGIHANSFGTMGARRLSIIDRDGGDQPIANEDGTLHIVFNGEIYNYRDLAQDLIQRGHKFKSRCDTEVVLHAYEEYGVRCVEMLRGMFAFAILSEDSIYIARDRFGIKPLYLTQSGLDGYLVFASEIKALLQWPALDVSLNLEMLGDHYVLGYATGAQTPFKEITSLEPGHYLFARRTGSGMSVSRNRYFRVSVEPTANLSIEDAMEQIRDALEESVALHVHADAPVGVTLSGGLDSSLLAFLAKRHLCGNTSTYTVACSRNSNDLHAANDVAQYLGTPHSETVLSFDEYLDAIPAYIRTGEMWDGLHGLPFFVLCRRMAGSLKVCINGEGADELFGGYWSYLRPQPTLATFKRRLAAARRIDLPVSSRAAGIVEHLLGSSTWGDYAQRLLVIYQQEQLENNHLRPLDRYTMALGIELRVPFLDDRVAHAVNALPIRHKVDRRLDCGKYILRKIALRYGSQAFGDDPILRGKEGMPSAGENHLRSFEAMCAGAVSDSYVSKHEFRRLFCTRDLRGRIHGKSDLILFDIFRDIFLRQRGTANGPSVKEMLDTRAHAAINYPRDAIAS